MSVDMNEKTIRSQYTVNIRNILDDQSDYDYLLGDISVHMIGQTYYCQTKERIYKIKKIIDNLDKNDPNYNLKYEKAQQLLSMLKHCRQLLGFVYSTKSTINRLKLIRVNKLSDIGQSNIIV